MLLCITLYANTHIIMYTNKHQYWYRENGMENFRQGQYSTTLHASKDRLEFIRTGLRHSLQNGSWPYYKDSVSKAIGLNEKNCQLPQENVVQVRSAQNLDPHINNIA